MYVCVCLCGCVFACVYDLALYIVKCYSALLLILYRSRLLIFLTLSPNIVQLKANLYLFCYACLCSLLALHGSPFYDYPFSTHSKSYLARSIAAFCFCHNTPLSKEWLQTGTFSLVYHFLVFWGFGHIIYPFFKLCYVSFACSYCYIPLTSYNF